MRLAEDLGEDAVRYQGNWIPHKIRPATEDGIFFAGDSAGHCLPLTAEGIRTAWHFGIACGRELQKVVDGRASREQALAAYGAFSQRHAWKFDWMLRAQRTVPRIPPRLLRGVVAAMGRPALSNWAFDHYLKIAPAPSDRLVARADRVADDVHHEVHDGNGHEPERRACRAAWSRPAAARARCRGRSPPGRTRLARRRPGVSRRSPGAIPSLRFMKLFGNSPATVPMPDQRADDEPRLVLKLVGHQLPDDPVASTTPVNMTSAPRHVLFAPNQPRPPSIGRLSGFSRSNRSTGACRTTAPSTGRKTVRSETAPFAVAALGA